MKPTKEQEMIIQAAGKYDKLKVIARAGTGKSSTIRMMMEEYVEPSIYLVYNKALKDEAETWVPSHVSVKTMHGLAYRVAGPELRHKLNPKNNPPYIKINRLRSTKELAKQFSLPTFYGDDGADLSGLGVASYLKEAMKRWEMSIDRDITTKHLPLKRIINDSAKHGWDKDEIIKVLEHTLKEWWKLRINPTHQSAIAHETLVKLWHLSDPEVEWGRIYIDEAQDIFPIVLDVIKKQEDKKIVIVGDDKQSIYMFTGAVNSLDYFPYHTLPLTQSFRYGQDIADLAVCAFPEKVELKGSPTIKSKIGEVDTSKPYAHLFRTNAALVNEGVRLLEQGKSVSMDFNVYDFKKKLDSVEALMKNKMRNVEHPEIAQFACYADFMEEAKDDPEIARLNKIVKSRGYKKLRNILEDYHKPRNPDVLLCTIHKSKGREWEQVKIEDDFSYPEEDEYGVLGELCETEQNLLYVAATRAVKTLEPNKLMVKLFLKRSEEEK